MAQLVEYVTSNDRLFYLWESGGGGGGVRVPLCTYVYVLKKINVLMYMCSRRFHNVLPEVSGCPNLGSSYKDKKKTYIFFFSILLFFV